MRIAIAGYTLESSTFTRAVSAEADFVVQRGAGLLARYDMAEILGADAEGVEWIPVVVAFGGAGGPIEPDTWERFAAEIVGGIAAAHAEAPLDGIYLDWHGASHTRGRRRDEEEMLRRIRAAVGDGVVISMSMDPHGNFSRELAELTDLATCFRHAPHIDNVATRARAIRNLVTVIARGRRPLKAWVRVPVLLPGERTSTMVEPGASVFLPAEAASHRPGVLDAAVWVGFAWADEDRNGGAVLVTGDDEGAIVETARELAQGFWDARADFDIVTAHSGQLSDALDLLLTGPATPVWIADSGDNVTGGGSGDISYAMHATLARPDVLASGLRIVFAQLIDPEAVDAAIAAGAGGTIDRPLGATIDDRFGGPVEGPWEVRRIVDGVFGEGPVAAILSNGLFEVGVHRTRGVFSDPADPSAFARTGHVWFDLSEWDVVVVKNGYFFPGQSALAATEFLALTPGGTDLDFSRLPFTEVWRPIFPLDDGFEADLAPVLIGPRD